ncbi:hypothetical protein BX666DRAFT_1909000 [Dichotomocladium elegans]|nr:hypothetical protein BX666DRAFT_1909000 [Dichotomocladium elegans]
MDLDIALPTHRASSKPKGSERVKQWRQRFRQQCTDRARSERQDQFDKRRLDKLSEVAAREEWFKFMQLHEEALKAEGIADFEMLHMEEEEYEQEQFVDEDAYFSNCIFCVHCGNAPLELDITRKLRCPCCGFMAAEHTVLNIKATIDRHELVCTGQIGYSPEPGSDAIYGLCDTCDLLEVF